MRTVEPTGPGRPRFGFTGTNGHQPADNLDESVENDPLRTSDAQLELGVLQSERSMAIAINVRADGESSCEVEQLWDQVAAFEDEPSMRTLGYRPHFTFAIYDSPAIDEETARQAMLRAATGEVQLRIGPFAT